MSRRFALQDTVIGKRRRRPIILRSLDHGDELSVSFADESSGRNSFTTHSPTPRSELLHTPFLPFELLHPFHDWDIDSVVFLRYCRKEENKPTTRDEHIPCQPYQVESEMCQLVRPRRGEIGGFTTISAFAHFGRKRSLQMGERAVFSLIWFFPHWPDAVWFFA